MCVFQFVCEFKNGSDDCKCHAALHADLLRQSASLRVAQRPHRARHPVHVPRVRGEREWRGRAQSDRRVHVGGRGALRGRRSASGLGPVGLAADRVASGEQQRLAHPLLQPGRDVLCREWREQQRQQQYAGDLRPGGARRRVLRRLAEAGHHLQAAHPGGQQHRRRTLLGAAQVQDQAVVFAAAAARVRLDQLQQHQAQVESAHTHHHGTVSVVVALFWQRCGRYRWQQ